MMKGKEKYEEIKDVYTFIFKHEKDTFMRVIAEIFKIPHILDGPSVKLITECVRTCITLSTNDIANLDIFNGYIRTVPDLKLMDDIEPKLDEISQSNSVPIGPEHNSPSKGFVYDFFVSHSHKDADWVLSRLVADLESAFTEDDVVLRGNPGPCGAGAIIYAEHIKPAARLHRPVAQRGSILLAELIAILMVLDTCITENIYMAIQRIKIFSDSQSAVGLLTLN
ncbi:Hypothetical predicted protein [Mytilus galloprovincialis]|uniref:RNase H type-1 domain-containing protein n=1 Tax=Mytilus galloprovincialis TaxID=29158 RepID=A0A8B6BLM6_MYTGA|nr:Hypothetical predicted protein [Mytilus galloprovincialis]